MENWIYQGKRYRLFPTPQSQYVIYGQGVVHYPGYSLVPCDGCTDQEYKHIVHANWKLLLMGDRESLHRDIIGFLYEDQYEHSMLMLLDVSQWKEQLDLPSSKLGDQLLSEIQSKKLKAKAVESISELRV